MKSRAEAAKYAQKCIGIANRGLSAQRTNSDLCDGFLVGNYMDVKGNVRGQTVQFSKPLPYINAVNGYLVQTRKRAKYVAMIQDAQQQIQYSKNANAVRDYTRSQNRADQVETRRDRQVLVKGYGAIATAMTYDKGFATRDPNGEIIKDEVTDYCGWDPMARKPNLTDRRYDFYRKMYDVKEAMELFDTNDENDFDGMGRYGDESGYKFDPTVGQPYDRSKFSFDWCSQSEDEKNVWVYFFEWYEVETFYKAENPVYKIQDPMVKQIAMARMDAIEADAKARDDTSMFSFDATAQELSFDAQTKTKLEAEFGDLFKFYAYKKKVFYTSICSGLHCFDVYKSPSQFTFWMNFTTGYWDAKNKLWFGMVNPMMEPTKYSNKAMTEMLYMIARTAKGGWFYEKNAIKNIRNFEANVNRTDGNVQLEDGGLEKIKSKSQQFNAAGYDQILTIANQTIQDMSGFDLQTMLGQSGSGNDSAMLFRQRVRQINSVLACYVDAIESATEEDARMELDFYRIYAENNNGGMVRLLGQQGAAQFIQISKDVFAPNYDVEIQEAPITQEEKLEQSATLVNIGTQLASIQSPAAPQCFMAAIKLQPIEEEDKQAILQAMQPPPPDPQVQALQNTQIQLQLKDTQGRIARQQAEIDKIKAQTQQIMVDSQKTDHDIGLTAAKTEESIQNANQTRLENALLPLKQVADIGVQVNA